MEDTEKLAHWILARTPYRREPMTHLKLQKLAFYCAGAALAFGKDAELGDGVQFEAWKHGPVCRPIWQQFHGYGGSPIPFGDPASVEEYPNGAERHMKDALRLYGPLTAWSLRQESHLEKPWGDVFHSHKADKTIPREVLRAHFEQKFKGARVEFPEYLFNSSSLRLDGIPVNGYDSLHKLAGIVWRMASSYA